MSFDDKFKTIVPKATDKDYSKLYQRGFTRISNLKKYRDEIIHTKINNKGQTPYEHLLSSALEFDYHETIDAVRDFINLHQKELIVDCPCNHPDDFS
jgi:hypothetical protein